MAEYSKAQQLQALEFLMQYLNTDGIPGNVAVNNRNLYAVIPELGGYLSNNTDDAMRNIRLIANSLDRPETRRTEVNERIAKTLNDIEGDERVQRDKANYVPGAQSHHLVGLNSQYTAAAELSMPEAIQFYDQINSMGYPVGTQLQHMLSLNQKGHNDAHISPRTGRSNKNAGQKTFSVVNKAIRDIRADEANWHGPAPNGLVNTNIALALPGLEQEKQVSLAAYNSPAQTELRRRLAKKIGVPVSMIDDAVNPWRTPNPNAKNQPKSIANRNYDLLKAKGINEKSLQVLYNDILSDPEIEKAQTQLLDDIVAGVSDKEIKGFNDMLDSSDGDYRIVNKPASAMTMEDLMSPADNFQRVRLAEADDLINSMSKTSIKNERIKREREELVALGEKPTNKPYRIAGDNYPKNLVDRKIGEMDRITGRLRPGAEEVLAPMAQDIPGLNRMIQEFKARRTGRR